MNHNDYTSLQIDTLKELVNIGSGNAATSISQIIDKPVKMEVPTIEILNYNEVYKDIMEEEEIVTAITMEMSGDGEGVFLYTSTEEDTNKLVNMMVPEGTELNKELKDSSIKELVNILVSSFLNAISKMINVKLILSTPISIVDMFAAILSSIYIELGQYDENIMIIKNEFFYLGEKIESDLYFIPKPGILEKLFKTIGV